MSFRQMNDINLDNYIYHAILVIYKHQKNCDWNKNKNVPTPNYNTYPVIQQNPNCNIYCNG